MRHLTSAIVLMSVAFMTAPEGRAQSEPALQFDVVSIKRNTSGTASGGIRTLPDSSVVMTNQPIRSVIMSASPTPAREVVGLPDWVTSERYDLTVKPPAGSTREQRSLMWQAMFKERMKVQAHVEERERDTFALVLARSDGRLGPQLKPSTLDCGPRPPGTPPPPPPAQPSSAADFQNRCGMMFGQGIIVSGGMLMDSFVQSLAGLAGGLVNNRTGLQGFYALTLKFSQSRAAAAPTDAAVSIDDAPEVFTALQEQLGLKLQREKSMVPVLVIDHIERPSEN